jgi:hypothetical protein
MCRLNLHAILLRPDRMAERRDVLSADLLVGAARSAAPLRYAAA